MSRVWVQQYDGGELESRNDSTEKLFSNKLANLEDVIA